MSAAQSLRASSDAFHMLGRDFDAQFARDLADGAEQAGVLGEALYGNWAGQMADRAERFSTNLKREAGRG